VDNICSDKKNYTRKKKKEKRKEKERKKEKEKKNGLQVGIVFTKFFTQKCTWNLI
jgi:hypothetical protein